MLPLAPISSFPAPMMLCLVKAGLTVSQISPERDRASERSLSHRFDPEVADVSRLSSLSADAVGACVSEWTTLACIDRYPLAFHSVSAALFPDTTTLRRRAFIDDLSIFNPVLPVLASPDSCMCRTALARRGRGRSCSSAASRRVQRWTCLSTRGVYSPTDGSSPQVYELMCFIRLNPRRGEAQTQTAAAGEQMGKPTDAARSLSC